MRISTPRFVIREYREDDRPAFATYRADPRYAALYGASESLPSRSDQLLARFRAWRGERPRRNFQLAVADRADCRLCGSVGLRDYDSRRRRAEFGLELAPDLWGRYRAAIEIGGAVLAFGFGTLELNEVFGHTAPDNRKIARLAEWCGARPVSSSAEGAISWRLSASAWRKLGENRALS